MVAHTHTHTHMCLHPKNTNTLFAYTFVLYLYMRDVVWRRWINITTYTRVDRYRKLKTRMRSVFGCGVRIWNWNIQHAATSSAELCDFIWIVFFFIFMWVLMHDPGNIYMASSFTSLLYWDHYDEAHCELYNVHLWWCLSRLSMRRR